VSKAFTRDEDETPQVLVPSRPPIPAGTPNYVTPGGLAALRAELHALEAERTRAEHEDNEADRAHALAALHTRHRDLEERIASAVLVDPNAHPTDEVRFGARVTVRGEEGTARRYEIVGVDEARMPNGGKSTYLRIAFVSPVARALLGKRVGDVVTLRSPRGEEELEVLAVRYGADGEPS
jgi:transcription elongation factor GreB